MSESELMEGQTMTEKIMKVANDLGYGSVKANHPGSYRI